MKYRFEIKIYFYMKPLTLSDLRTRQAWPLNQKIDHTCYAMETFVAYCKEHDRTPYVSFSGGLNSTVLLDLARRFVDPNMKGVFCSTGNEYPEIVRFVRHTDNIEIIHAGLVKFVAGGREAFLVKYNSMNQSGKYVAPGIDEPCPTVATQNRLGVAKVYYLCKHFGGSPEGKCTAVDAPAGAITCRDHHAFVSAYYGNGFNSSIERPSPTVTTKDRFQLVRPFFANYYSGGGQTSGTDGPAPAVMTNPKQRLVTPWIMNTNFSNVGSSLDAPAQTATANRKWQYLMNPQFASAGAATDRPCFTLIARMDKRPPRLVTAEADGEALPSFIRLEDETLVYEIYPEDTPMLVQIKEFMALYGLVDIRMRMLRIPELKRIMGFPDNYVLIGTQGEQKKFIGNAVEVNMARVLCEALVAKLYELNITPQRFAA